MTGSNLIGALVAFIALFGGSVYLVSRLLPETSPARKQVEAIVTWIKQNPDTFWKRLKLAALILIASVFTLLTFIYS